MRSRTGFAELLSTRAKEEETACGGRRSSEGCDILGAFTVTTDFPCRKAERRAVESHHGSASEQCDQAVGVSSAVAAECQRIRCIDSLVDSRMSVMCIHNNPEPDKTRCLICVWTRQYSSLASAPVLDTAMQSFAGHVDIWH
jgi:hypothetical protein